MYAVASCNISPSAPMNCRMGLSQMPHTTEAILEISSDIISPTIMEHFLFCSSLKYFATNTPLDIAKSVCNAVKIPSNGEIKAIAESALSPIIGRFPANAVSVTPVSISMISAKIDGIPKSKIN